MPMNYLNYLYSSMKSLIKKRYMFFVDVSETLTHVRRKQIFYILVLHYMYSEIKKDDETCFFPACQGTPFTPSCLVVNKR